MVEALLPSIGIEIPHFSNTRLTISLLWLTSSQAVPTHFVNRIQWFEADKLLFKYSSRLLCICLFWWLLTIALNSLLNATFNGWTKLVQPGGTRRNKEETGQLLSYTQQGIAWLWQSSVPCVHQQLEAWAFVHQDRWAFPHIVNPLKHHCLVTASIILEYYHHSTIVLLPFSLRNSQSFPTKDEQWLYSSSLYATSVTWTFCHFSKPDSAPQCQTVFVPRWSYPCPPSNVKGKGVWSTFAMVQSSDWPCCPLLSPLAGTRRLSWWKRPIFSTTSESFFCATLVVRHKDMQFLAM